MKTVTYNENEWRLVPVVDDQAALRDLYGAYVRLLEAGRDRIRDLGGECDAVYVMERNDPALIRVRAMLEAAPHPPAVEEGLEGGKDSQVLTALITELRSREQVGRKKYGQDLDRIDLSADQLRQHLREELMDALMYSHAMDRAHPQRDAADAVVSELKALAACAIRADILKPGAMVVLVEQVELAAMAAGRV